MKVSKVQASENRDAIVEAAAGLVRSNGFAGMGVADVSLAAGFTHGALYSHFGSKEVLKAEATRHAFAQTVIGFTGLSPEAFLGRYLSAAHRDNPQVGCPNAALVSEVWRQPLETREAFHDGLNGFVELTAATLRSGELDHSRDRALTMFSAMVGGLALARAIRDIDPEQSDDMLRAVASQLASFIGAASPD